MMRAPLTTLLALGTAASLGCSRAESDMEIGAEPERTTVTVNDAEVATAAGVQVRAMPVTRTSRYQNEMEYLPVHLEIRNRSDQPLRLRYDAFALGPGGADAVPVHWLDQAQTGMPGIGGLPASGWRESGYEVAGEYADLFPDATPYEGEFEETTVDAYRARGGAGELGAFRDRELLADVIPEGVIRPGGFVDGTVWFERPDDVTGAVPLTLELVNAESGERFGEIRVSLDLSRAMVERGSETWQPPQ